MPAPTPDPDANLCGHLPHWADTLGHLPDEPAPTARPDTPARPTNGPANTLPRDPTAS